MIGAMDNIAPAVPWVLLVIGFGLFFYERESIRLGIRSYSWKSVRGRLVERDHELCDIVESVGIYGLARVSRSLPVYWYEFQVGQKTYQGNRYSFGSIMDTLIPKYVVGQSVTVFYDPTNPGDAVLKRGVAPGSLIGLIPLCGAGLWWFLRYGVNP
jgi:hypothetical protein